MSLSTTGMPAAAIVWAIWPPIVPAPTTAALNTNMRRSPVLVGLRETSEAPPRRTYKLSRGLIRTVSWLHGARSAHKLRITRRRHPARSRTLARRPKSLRRRATRQGVVAAAALAVGVIAPAAAAAACAPSVAAG